MRLQRSHIPEFGSVQMGSRRQPPLAYIGNRLEKQRGMAGQGPCTDLT
jgi:hypothetical protein